MSTSGTTKTKKLKKAKETPRFDKKDVGPKIMSMLRDTYFGITGTYKQKVGVCKVTTPNAEGRAVECGKTYSNPLPPQWTTI
jgi:hypothetical protein